MIISLVASAICTPSKKEIQSNMKKFIEEIKTYKYNGDNLLIRKFLDTIQNNNNLQLEYKYTQIDIDQFKDKLKNALITVIRK
jgi:uncharacterized protein YpuA (DUF1002 family)